MLSMQFTKLVYYIINYPLSILNKITRQEKIPKYFLKLDGYYYCEKKKRTIAVIRVRNKRTVEQIPIKQIAFDENYLRSLHPLDACIIGILSNNERNGIIDKDASGWKKMQRLKSCYCFTRTNPILKISGKYTDSMGVEITTLHSEILNKEIQISTIELAKNQALLYSLNSFDAISVGYNISEQYIKNQIGS